jgi:DNA polymerase-3 subunit delta'
MPVEVFVENREPLPWYQEMQAKLVQLKTTEGLAHSLLVGGPAGIGKTHFAKSLAFALLCRQAGAVACGQCSSCRLVLAGSHSDLRWVHPEDSQQIRIDQIRQLVSWANQTSQQGGLKVAIIEPAERMNLAAANALLKILEEPASDTFFILVSAMPMGLLATIRSRCQQVSSLRPEQNQALLWLNEVLPESSEGEVLTALHLAGGSPLRAYYFLLEGRSQGQVEILELLIQLIKGGLNPVKAATQALDKTHPLDIYDLLYWLLSESLRHYLYDTARPRLSQTLEESIAAFVQVFSVKQLLLMNDQVISARRLLTGTGNPNLLQLLESLLILLFEEAHKPAAATLVE